MVTRRDAGRISRECIWDDRPGQESVAPEDLVTFEVGETVAKIGTRAFPMRVTTTLQDAQPDAGVKERIIAASRRHGAAPAADRTEERAPPEGPAETAAGIPPDPFADLADPQDLY